MFFTPQPIPDHNPLAQWFKNRCQRINSSGFVQAYIAMCACRRSTGTQARRGLPRQRLAFDRTVFADDPSIRAKNWERWWEFGDWNSDRRKIMCVGQQWVGLICIDRPPGRVWRWRRSDRGSEGANQLAVPPEPAATDHGGRERVLDFGPNSGYMSYKGSRGGEPGFGRRKERCVPAFNFREGPRAVVFGR